MWVRINIAEHMWERNLAETLTEYLNENKIAPKTVITLMATEKDFDGVGWQDEPDNDDYER